MSEGEGQYWCSLFSSAGDEWQRWVPEEEARRALARANLLSAKVSRGDDLWAEHFPHIAVRHPLECNGNDLELSVLVVRHPDVQQFNRLQALQLDDARLILGDIAGAAERIARVRSANRSRLILTVSYHGWISRADNAHMHVRVAAGSGGAALFPAWRDALVAECRPFRGKLCQKTGSAQATDQEFELLRVDLSVADEAALRLEDVLTAFSGAGRTPVGVVVGFFGDVCVFVDHLKRRAAKYVEQRLTAERCAASEFPEFGASLVLQASGTLAEARIRVARAYAPILQQTQHVVEGADTARGLLSQGSGEAV